MAQSRLHLYEVKLPAMKVTALRIWDVVSPIWNDVLSGRAEMSYFYWRPKKGDSITLEVSSNCDEVELFQNGKSLGVKRNNLCR